MIIKDILLLSLLIFSFHSTSVEMQLKHVSTDVEVSTMRPPSGQKSPEGQGF